MMNRRITIFDAAGAGSRSIGAATSQGMSMSTVSLAAGHYYQTGETFMMRTRADAEGDPPIPLVRFASDGTPVDTLWRHQPPPTTAVRFEMGGRSVTRHQIGRASCRERAEVSVVARMLQEDRGEA